MKKLLLSVLASGFLFLINSCDKNPKLPSGPSDVAITIKTIANGKEIILGNQDEYITDDGVKFIANVFKYYISNAKLVNSNGTEVALGNYSLIDCAANGKRGFTFNAVPEGTYTKLVFNMGVDKLQNSNGNGVEDLNSSTGMFWGAKAGYLFFKHEGKYTKLDGTKDNLLFHYGSNYGYVSDITIPLSDFKVQGVAKKITLALNVQKLYKGLDIIGRPFVMVDDALPNDVAWTQFLANNFTKSFELVSAE
jgi:hypothetical protein